MENRKFTGAGVALITPFKKDFSIDFDALGKLMDMNIAGGINYFVVLGTTGESATLSKEEKKQVWKFCSGHVKGRVPLVAGIGGNNTAEVAAEMEQFDVKGYDAFLSVSPSYNRPQQEGIVQHFLKLAKVAPLPIILYNVPSRTSSNMNAETTLKLAHASKKITGIKEASGNFMQMMRIVNEKPDDFLMISGDDLLTLPLMSISFDGVISVVAQAAPKKYAEMMKFAWHGEFGVAGLMHYKLLDLMDLFFAEGSPAGVKAALHTLGVCKNILRLPLVPVSDGLMQKIKAAMENVNRKDKQDHS